MTNTDDVGIKTTQNTIFKDVSEFSDKKRTKSSKIPIKEYAQRNSLLTDLYENKHISTIYHLFLEILLWLFVTSAAHDYLYRGRIRMGVDLIIKGFPTIHYAVLVWIAMFLSSFLPYYGLAGWAQVRVRLGPKSTIRKIWDYSAFAVVVLYYAGFLTAVPMLTLSLNLKIAETFTLLCDAVRLIMKSHAFIRSNASRVLTYKPHVEDQILYPTLKQFLYFSFIPATVYQDEYPRTKKINWNNVILCIFEFIACVLLISCVIEIFYVNAYEEFGTRKYESRELTMLLLRNAFGGLLIFLGIFYVVLHVWMNLFAEFLRFSDRMFYKDWWTSDNYDRYYRTWNVVVHDWLYTYVYKDLYEVVMPKNKVVPKLLVFFISAVFHEYILALSFGFFFPILFINFFVLSIPVTFIRFKSAGFGNFFLWFSIPLGMSINTCAYAMEYYCRANTHTTNATWEDLLKPKLFNCL